ncbi:hypothetical protein DVR12_04020 [Chitinophaga silvatica]|uniref:Outer membrane protein beta-barrel domain-containing protein n=1 Tax=Chitinophaga silvatica TaxID=2282649 RepID=A0A3E1YHW6_9BACT|nr:outer membrane beta-barrel protein [Chitinophaga silvatica]RFS26957.1 hypothetical protein DVR12_04020 [Chitinophaga silvatica]
MINGKAVVLLLLGCFLFCFSVQAQIKGRVFEKSTGTGIAFVNIALCNTDSSILSGTISDSLGRFNLDKIPDARILVFSALGYERLYYQLHPDSFILNISLTESKTSISEVVVNGKQTEIVRQADRLIFNIGSPSFKAAANALDILKKIPGVQVASDGTISLYNGTVTIFLDGKPVQLSPDALQQLLSTLQPDAIANLSVIQPSAKFDGEYKNIIDIKLKQNNTTGWRGNINLQLQQNEYNLSDNNVNLQYKTPKVLYKVLLGYTTGTGIYRYNALQHLHNTNYQATSTEILTGTNRFSYQWGIDYQITKNQQIGVLWRAFYINKQIDSQNDLLTRNDKQSETVAHSASSNLSTPRQNNQTIDLSYNVRLKKGELQLLASMSNFSNNQQEDIQHIDLPSADLISYWKTALKNKIAIRTWQADYTVAGEKYLFNAGVRSAYSTTGNDLQYDTINNRSIFELDSSRTNSFRYRELINAGYLTYQLTKEKWQFQLGIRAEHTYSKAEAITTKDLTKRNFLTWLPGIVVNWHLKDNDQIVFTANRRITRPNFDMLNPFRFYFSPLNYRVGNPLLQPAITNKLSIAYSLKSYQVNVFAGRDEHPLGRYPVYDTVTNTLAYLGKNFEKTDFLGAGATIPIQVNRWWQMNFNIEGYYRKERTPYLDTVYAIPVLDAAGSGSQTFTLPKNWTLDIFMYYHTRGGNSLYYIRPFGNIDIGIRKSWLNNRLQTKLNAYDLTNSNVSSLRFRDKNVMDNRFTHWYGQRRVVLTMILNFGKVIKEDKIKPKGEEERRVGI